MDLIYSIISKAIEMEATDIHLAPHLVPVYRVNRKLIFDEGMIPMDELSLDELLKFFYNNTPALKEKFDERKQADFSYSYKDTRFRINISMS